MFDLTGDIPTLYETKTVDPPGGNHPWLGTPLKDGAGIKYDISRRFRVATISSDTDVLSASLAVGPNVLAYPSDPLEGNDDPDVGGEDPPYLINSVGTTAVMKDVDQPHHQIAHSLGADNATFVELAQFQEFGRVQIGGKWYCCSDDFLSEITFKGKKISGKWQDDGSQFVTGNNSTFPPQ